jgi:Predicted membrane protein
VIAGIAADLAEAIREQGSGNTGPHPKAGPTAAELTGQAGEGGAVLLAPVSGYVQFIRHQSLVRLATEADAVISLEHRPGHFSCAGTGSRRSGRRRRPRHIRQALGRAHVVGPHRTLSQDVSFGIDQLVEIALRALSAAVNDTFTALTCIDWLGENLCKIVASGIRPGCTGTTAGSSGSSRPSRPTNGWCSAPSRRSGSRASASRP